MAEAQDWGSFVQGLVQEVVTEKLATGSDPVAAEPGSGRVYVEGQPVGALGGVPPMYLMIGGGVLLLAVAAFMLRRK